MQAEVSWVWPFQQKFISCTAVRMLSAIVQPISNEHASSNTPYLSPVKRAIESVSRICSRISFPTSEIN